jgi:hypothetical protein
MLETWTKKFCPLLTLALTAVGCGKKLGEADGQSAKQTENQERPSTYVLQIDGNQNQTKQFFAPSAARFEIPRRLNLVAGSSTGNEVEVAFNVSIYDEEDFDYLCIYKPQTGKKDFYLTKCIDYNFEDLGEIQGQAFSIYAQEIIQMNLKGANTSDLSVQAIFKMHWFE